MTRSNGSDWRSRLARLRGCRRLRIFVGVPLAIILFIANAVAFLIDEPLRRYTEAKMNRALKGYTVHLKTLSFHPHGFSLELKGITLIQDAHPDPPVADIPYLHASVNWKALLRGRVVGDMLIDRPMPTMNDLFRAHGNFDVTAGEFSFFSEMAVHDGVITGYVKPLFKDMTVYDPKQDKDKSFTHKVYERVVGGVAKLLKNRPREEVATKADISGRLDNPNVTPAEVIIHLIQNAFFKAILPGLQRDTKRAKA